MKQILLGITGSIAAYKAPELIRELRSRECEVKVVLTEGGKAFVTPLTLQALSGHPVYETLLDPTAEASMSHISLARWADFVLIAPASADFIAKLTHGFADDLLSTLCLATQAPIYLAPAMNQAMWSHPATQHNINTLTTRGIHLLGPAEGIQACGESGFGRMVEPSEIVQQLPIPPDTSSSLQGKRILITAGPTQEPIDPVRFLSNRSSGKMGFALAQAAQAAGAEVTLITGPTSIPPPANCHVIRIRTAEEMFHAVKTEIATQAIFISAAAVADYSISLPATEKIKKTASPLTLTFEPTPDILQWVCQQSPRPLCVGFAAETQEVITHAQAKRSKKGADFIIANDVGRSDIGFESDYNAVIIISDKKTIHLEKAPKLLLAKQILREITRA